MTIIHRALIAFALGLAAATAQAQTYPSKTITIVVPASPGGVTDTLGRALAQRLSAAWGQQAIVEGKPGANNQIAAEFTAKSAPDGHTLFVAPEGTFIANPSLYPKLNYDPYKDFTPVVGLAVINHALIVHPSVPAQNLQELLALAKAKPGTLNYGTFGIGSSGHLNMELLQSMTGVKLQAVHYKGATPALTDVIAGHIQLMFISVGSALPQAKAGKVKLLAIGADKRMALLPEVPTIAESGVPGYRATSWFGLFGPANMPKDVVARINGEVRRIFEDGEFRKAFLDRYYFTPLADTPEALAAFVKSEEPKWRKVIQDAKVKAE
jgi:tripartite-type tricarboxylate transporter receptor subunit TctC